jgi:hypothetical protein
MTRSAVSAEIRFDPDLPLFGAVGPRQFLLSSLEARERLYEAILTEALSGASYSLEDIAVSLGNLPRVLPEGFRELRNQLIELCLLGTQISCRLSETPGGPDESSRQPQHLQQTLRDVLREAAGEDARRWLDGVSREICLEEVGVEPPPNSLLPVTTGEGPFPATASTLEAVVTRRPLSGRTSTPTTSALEVPMRGTLPGTRLQSRAEPGSDSPAGAPEVGEGGEISQVGGEDAAHWGEDATGAMGDNATPVASLPLSGLIIVDEDPTLPLHDVVDEEELRHKRQVAGRMPPPELLHSSREVLAQSLRELSGEHLGLHADLARTSGDVAEELEESGGEDSDGGWELHEAGVVVEPSDVPSIPPPWLIPPGEARGIDEQSRLLRKRNAELEQERRELNAGLDRVQQLLTGLFLAEPISWTALSQQRLIPSRPGLNQSLVQVAETVESWRTEYARLQENEQRSEAMARSLQETLNIREHMLARCETLLGERDSRIQALQSLLDAREGEISRLKLVSVLHHLRFQTLELRHHMESMLGGRSLLQRWRTPPAETVRNWADQYQQIEQLYRNLCDKVAPSELARVDSDRVYIRTMLLTLKALAVPSTPFLTATVESAPSAAEDSRGASEMKSAQIPDPQKAAS